MHIPTLLSLPLLATLALSQPQQPPDKFRFKLYATTYRYAKPALSGYVDIIEGTAGFSRTGNASYDGFVSYMRWDSSAAWPNLPTNDELKAEAGNIPAWLKPTGTPDLFDLRFGPVPKVKGVLYKSFSVTELICGGNCGGLQVVYDLSSNTRRWVAVPAEGGGGGYTIRWYNGTVAPKGSYPVWLWRN